MTKLGMIVRADNTGLGNQTRNLCYMLKPDFLMIVNSEPFNGNAQHFEWYDGFNSMITQGWPTNAECLDFMKEVTHLITAETVYNVKIFAAAKQSGAKVFIQPNWEFLDHLNIDMPQPTKWFMPSYWKLEEMIDRFPNTVYLPPPLFVQDFVQARASNFQYNDNTFLHIVGKQASQDRNGTLDLIDAVSLCRSKFKLIIKSQFPLEGVQAYDNRIIFDIGDVKDHESLYSGYDAMILPRRYAGLCLPMNEALMSALPVFMPDISPNNKVLPPEWLYTSQKVGEFIARAVIDVHQSSAKQIASKIDWYCNLSSQEKTNEKFKAFTIAHDQYSSEVLLQKYKDQIYETN